MILTPLQKMPKNVEDLGKIIVAKGLKKLPKIQKIAQSGHTGLRARQSRYAVRQQQKRRSTSLGSL